MSSNSFSLQRIYQVVRYCCKNNLTYLSSCFKIYRLSRKLKRRDEHVLNSRLQFLDCNVQLFTTLHIPIFLYNPFNVYPSALHNLATAPFLGAVSPSNMSCTNRSFAKDSAKSPGSLIYQARVERIAALQRLGSITLQGCHF